MPFVEEILGKYQSNTPVPVDRFVIVSSSGFTKGAKEKAAADDVELLTLEEAYGKDWAAVRSRPQSIARPQLTGFALGPKWDDVDLRLAYENGHLICPHGNDHGTPVEYAKAAFRRWSTKAHPGLENSLGESSGASGRVALELSDWRLRLDGCEYPVSCMVLTVHITVQKGLAVHKTFERRSTKAESKTIHHFDGPLGEMVFSQGPPIVNQYPPGSAFQQPTNEELVEAIRSVFPDGITIKFPDLPPATLKFDDSQKVDETGRKQSRR